VLRLNLRVGEIREWQLGHGFGTQPKGWGVRGAQARSRLFNSLRGAGQMESRVSRDSHMRYEGQGHYTET
jgi:hypothetical protein